MTRHGRLLSAAAVLLFLASLTIPKTTPALAQQKGEPGAKLAATPAPAVPGFDERVKEYVKLRERLEGKLPKLPPDSEPAKIDAHQAALAEKIKEARAGTRPGEIFSPPVARHFRDVIRGEYQGEKLKELRGKVREADTKGVPLRVNTAYPETKESIDMPPTLLLALPQLPKQLRYRFVGRNLLLVDREARLIIDYMPDAVP